MLNVPVYFPPLSLFAIFLPPPTYLRDEGEKMHELKQHFELLGSDYAEKVRKLMEALAAPLSG